MDRIERDTTTADPKSNSPSLLTEVLEHTKKTWSDVLTGHGTTGQYLEVGAEVLAGAVAVRFGVRELGTDMEKVSAVSEDIPATAPNPFISLGGKLAPQDFAGYLRQTRKIGDSDGFAPLISFKPGDNSVIVPPGSLEKNALAKTISTLSKDAEGQSDTTLLRADRGAHSPPFSGEELSVPPAIIEKTMNGHTVADDLEGRSAQIQKIIERGGDKGLSVAMSAVRRSLGDNGTTPEAIRDMWRSYTHTGAEAYLDGMSGNEYTEFLNKTIKNM